MQTRAGPLRSQEAEARAAATGGPREIHGGARGQKIAFGAGCEAAPARSGAQAEHRGGCGQAGGKGGLLPGARRRGRGGQHGSATSAGGRRRGLGAAAALRLAPPAPARRGRLLLGCLETRGGRSGGEGAMAARTARARGERKAAGLSNTLATTSTTNCYYSCYYSGSVVGRRR